MPRKSRKAKTVHPKVHPALFVKWRSSEACLVCGHLGSVHKGLWDDFREYAVDKKSLRTNPVCIMQCHKCPKVGSRLAVCYQDACGGRPVVNSPLAISQDLGDPT